MKHVLLILFTLFVMASVGHAETLSLTTADTQEHPRARSMNAVLTECFKRMGVDLEIHPMPSERSLYDANSGSMDGNFVRTMGISKAYPNLIAVPEPISKNVIVAFSKYGDISVDGWKSLLPYHVAWVRGWKNCDRELWDAKSITRVPNETVLFRFLNEGRAQVGVFGLETGNRKLRELDIEDVKPLSPPITESPLYLYMNVKHADRVDEIARTLRAMKQDGTYQAIIDMYYN